MYKTQQSDFMRIQHAYDCLLQHVHILITCKYFDVVQTNGMFKNAWQSLPKPHTGCGPVVGGRDKN